MAVRKEYCKRGHDLAKHRSRPYGKRGKTYCLACRKADPKRALMVRVAVAEYKALHPAKVMLDNANRRAAKICRTPVWADKAEISAVYERAAKLRASGVDFHVDHEIPLQGELVSGLHVSSNLRLLPRRHNLRKGNQYAVT